MCILVGKMPAMDTDSFHMLFEQCTKIESRIARKTKIAAANTKIGRKWLTEEGFFD